MEKIMSTSHHPFWMWQDVKLFSSGCIWKVVQFCDIEQLHPRNPTLTCSSSYFICSSPLAANHRESEKRESMKKCWGDDDQNQESMKARSLKDRRKSKRKLGSAPEELKSLMTERIHLVMKVKNLIKDKFRDRQKLTLPSQQHNHTISYSIVCKCRIQIKWILHLCTKNYLNIWYRCSFSAKVTSLWLWTSLAMKSTRRNKIINKYQRKIYSHIFLSLTFIQHSIYIKKQINKKIHIS